MPPWILAIEFYAPLLLWCILVQYFSSDAFSYSETSGWLTPLLRLLLPMASPDSLDLAHQFVRKLSHVVEFGVLGGLVARCPGGDSQGVDTLRAAIFVLTLAGMDEWGQSMTLTRGPSWVDVGYDCLGGAIGIGWILTRRNRRH